MARYGLQKHIRENNEWIDSEITFNTKKQLDEWIDNRDLLNWRCGYTFLHYGHSYIQRFVWITGKKKGQEVKP